MLISFFPGALAFAASEEQESHVSGDYECIILDNGTAAIIGYSGKTENLEIPEKLDGLTVTIIGGYAFSDRFSLTSVTIHDSVTSIGGMTFSECRNLKYVTIPDSVNSSGLKAQSPDPA